MRNKIAALFGYLMPTEESVMSYLARMDKIGHLDEVKRQKILAIMAEEIEKISLEMAGVTNMLKKLMTERETNKESASSKTK